ncbi:MAG: hypothetical protein NC402_06635 [Prevotella sp.]|nr:hypothetical protein [Prevotella sp.]MCM1075395.1 hypothetical protein [Ruminococcus sp.]
MKKFLLLGALALASASTAMALPKAPEVYANQYIYAISPNGRYAVSEMFGNVVITNLETGTVYEYYADGEKYYGVGSGNCVSSNGIIVGSVIENGGDPSYWQNGQWKSLPNPDNRNIYMRCISADGSVAVAIADVIPSDNAPAGMMYVGVVWNLGEDGKWSNPVTLPFETVDFSGRVPQGESPISIADDGKTIAAQFIDYTGFFLKPIVYTQDSEGKWSYKNWGGKLINPTDLKFPEFDEDNAPVDPASHVTDYMSDPEKKAAYEEAYANFLTDYQNYPEPTDYMTEEDLKNYDAAVLAYNEAAEKYNTEWEAFYTQFSKMYDTSALLTYGQAFITPDAKYVLSTNTRSMEDPDDPFNILETQSPILMQAESAEYLTLEGADYLYASALAADGTVLAYNEDSVVEAYIKPAGKEWQTLYSFFVSNTEEAQHEWLKENLCHTFDSMNWITGESISYVDQPVMGVTCCTPDLSLIAATAENVWDYENDPVSYYSYIIPTPSAALGVNGVAAEGDFILKAGKGGIVEVSESAQVLVYDMQGRLVFSANDVIGAVATGLEDGLYTVKATNASGGKVLKAMF